jgi:Mn2+/Fe2+ NRAMP family transporter
MGLVVAATFGLIVWIVLWALGVKAIDSFIITLLVVLVGATARMLAPYLPGNRNR